MTLTGIFTRLSHPRDNAFFEAQCDFLFFFYFRKRSLFGIFDIYNTEKMGALQGS